MGTRGIYGFYKGGKTKVTYSHYDSYPSGLGLKTVDFATTISIEEMNRIFDEIKMVGENSPVSEQQLEECKEWLKTHDDYNGVKIPLGQGTNTNWYNLLRKAQGNLFAYTKGLRYMTNSEGFLQDSLFCEWGYIINLDSNMLEVYKGFQKKKTEGNRYGTTRRDGYYPCAIVELIPLENKDVLVKRFNDLVRAYERVAQ